MRQAVREREEKRLAVGRIAWRPEPTVDFVQHYAEHDEKCRRLEDAVAQGKLTQAAHAEEARGLRVDLERFEAERKTASVRRAALLGTLGCV